MSDSRQVPSPVGNAVPGPDREPENAQDGRSVAVLGPFTARDVAVFAGVLVIFVGSVLPLVQRGTLLNLWNAQNLYFIGIGILLPLVLAGLFAWRRLAPSATIRVGSLSLDQFGSVVAVLACSYFFVFAVTALTPGGVVGFVGGAVLVAATVLGRFVPGFAKDFAGRPHVPAHVVARDAVAPVVKPKAPKAQEAKAQAPQAPGAGTPSTAAPPTAPTGAAAPWAGSLAHDGGRSPAAPTAPPAPTAVAPAASSGATAAGAAAAAGAVAAAATGGKPTADAERSTTMPPKAPVGQSADDAVVLGDADGEAYGAPGEATPPAPAQEAPTTVQDTAQEPAPETVTTREPTPEPVAEPEPAPTLVEPEVGPPTQAAPATQVAPAVDRYTPFEATRSVEEPEPEYEAFWFAVNQSRTAFDPNSGLPVFTLEPGQWILALQDRGNEFLVQSQDGRIGIVRDLSGIERG